MIRHGLAKVAARAVNYALEYVTGIVMNDDGTIDASGAGDRPVTTETGQRFGFYSRTKDDAVGVVLSFAGLSFLVAYADAQFSMSLQKGEVGIQNAFSASVLLDKNGNVTQIPGGSGKVQAGAASGNEPMVLGNTLQTRLADLEAKFVAHVHPVVFGACTAGGTTGTAPTSATTSTLPHSGDVIKSTKAEVSP